MAQADFEAAIADVRSGSGATEEADLVTLYSDFLGAVDAELASADDASPAAQKLRAVRQRVLERQNETNPSGAGLNVLPNP